MLVDICGFSTQSLTKRAMVYQTVCLSMILILRLHEKSINFNILKDLSFFFVISKLLFVERTVVGID